MLTRDEAELYDRQIRLWGVNAQSRIRQSKVLMLGFNGIASEVAKILVLAGIDTLTIVDDHKLQATDLTSNLFCRKDETEEYRTHSVKAKLKVLNPLVKVIIDNNPISSKTPEDYKGYDLVTLHSFLKIDDINSINDICRINQIKFYMVLDYGYFGFMFNDLGPEFKFIYEEFNNLVNKDKGLRQSGEEKNPISICDDELAVEDCSDGENSSDEDDRRPKKRLRVNSPDRKPAKQEYEKEKETKFGNLTYVAFKDMISLNNCNFTKQTSPILLTSLAMLKFYSQFGFLPRNGNDQIEEEDIQNLKKILSSLEKDSELSDKILDKLNPEWIKCIYGSLSPVCAVVGGVAGQDMIRALSGRDIPLNNTFAFDGITMNGGVEKVGLSDKNAQTIQPVVRDFLQIDDDD